MQSEEHKLYGTKAQNCETHPYLLRKQVKNFGARLYKRLLVIPLQNSDGEICSLQFISASGAKRFLTDGQTKGCYFVIGSVDIPVNEQTPLYISEGFATAATIHEVTNCTVIVAFYAGNLLPVAQIMRKKYPTREIIICADNDQY